MDEKLMSKEENWLGEYENESAEDILRDLVESYEVFCEDLGTEQDEKNIILRAKQFMEKKNEQIQ